MKPIYKTGKTLFKIALLCVFSFSALHAQQNSKTQLWVTGNNVRIRSGPSLSSSIIGLLQAGDNVLLIEKGSEILTIAGRKGSWNKISFRGPSFEEKIGFVFSAFLVSDEKGPPGLEKKAEALRETSPKEAIETYKQILTEFPHESEVGLFTREVWIKVRIATIECWQAKEIDGAESPESLWSQLREPTVKQNRHDLFQLAGCTFLQWDSPCVGDPLPHPASEHDIDEYLKFGKNFNWSSLKQGCVDDFSGKVKYCFSPEEHKHRFFWAGGCIEKKQ